VGSFVLLFCFCFSFPGFEDRQQLQGPRGEVLAIGVSAMIFWQAFVNIGMVVGLVPVVGVPLPLFSYGRDLGHPTTLFGIGILMNVSMRRFMLNR